MEAFALYLFKSSVWLTGFALVYVLFLRNERFFSLNRIYLVSGILISIIFPFFTWHYSVLLPVVPNIEVSDPQVQGITMAPEESFNPQNLLLLFYFSGISYLIYRILRQTLSVFRIIQKSETSQYSSAKLIRTDAYPASFSFFSFVFVNPSIDEIETNEIVNHELEHIRQQHWIDLLLFEILRTMLWFNPVSWLYGHLIRQNHEYLADERALQRTSNPAIYRAALLNQMFGGPVISLANSFNYSLNKKRFIMMKQTISSPIRKLKLLVVLPLIAGVFYAFAAPEYKFIGGVENQSPQKSLYTITKDKIDIPFTTQFQKSDLDAVKSDLDKFGMKIDYTTLDFTKVGNLKQISATVKSSDGGSVSFTSGELTTTNYPTFKTYSDGSFGVYFQKAVTGKVVSEDGKPLKGASVVVSGKTIGTVTDDNGRFKLVLTDDSPIVISYVGFETQKVNPDFGKEMVINMKTRIVGIDPVGNDASVSAKESKPLEISDNVLVIIKGEESTTKYGEKGKNGVVEITSKSKTPYILVEQMPSFPGGVEALNAFINANLKYPPIALENGIQGRVFVGFVVDKIGEIKNVKISRGVDPSLDKEAMRIVRAMPNWKPGKQNGESVEVAYELPINFNLPADYHQKSKEKLRNKTSSKIGNINWVNNTIYSSAKLNEVLGMKEGEEYSKEKVKERIFGEVANLYLDNGYLFNNIQITEIPKDESTTDLKFTIFEGNSFKIGKIEIKGNKTVATKDILNKIAIKSGDLFSRTKLTQSVRALATIDKLDPEKINPDVNPVLAKTIFEFNIVNIVLNVTEK